MHCIIASEAKRRELLLHAYGIKKQPPKIFKNGRRKFFQTQKFSIFHAELISYVNRPDPARPDPTRPTMTLFDGLYLREYQS